MIIPIIYIITPVKNEYEYIEKTITSMINQTIRPYKWLIVDDGSTDDTRLIIENYTSKYDWIELLKKDSTNEARSGGSKVVRAFNFGYERIKHENFEYIVKLDGDLILPPDYFEKIIQEFESNNNLGICGGTIVNKYSENDLRVEKTEEYHVRGALKTIRKKCWFDIGGFKEIWNWDGLDIMEAQYKGWITKSIDSKVIHLRPTTSAYEPKQHAFKSGYESYKMGADIFLTIVRLIVRLSKKPYLLVGYNFLAGYFTARKNKEPLIVSIALARFMNKTHYKRFNVFK